MVTINMELKKINRLVQFYGDEGVVYEYNGYNHYHKPWIPLLSKLKMIVDPLAQIGYNSAGVTLYPNGSYGISGHQDGIPGTIATVSFGAERICEFEDSKGTFYQQIVLEHGSILEMQHEFQQLLLHGIQKNPEVKEARVSIVFRKIPVEVKENVSSEQLLQNLKKGMEELKQQNSTMVQAQLVLRQEFDEFKRRKENELSKLRRQVALLKLEVNKSRPFWQKKDTKVGQEKSEGANPATKVGQEKSEDANPVQLNQPKKQQQEGGPRVPAVKK